MPPPPFFSDSSSDDVTDWPAPKGAALKQTTCVDAFRRAPVGSYVASQSFLVWCAAPDLYGFAVWGYPDEAETRRLCELLDVELRPEAAPHASLVDMRHLRGIDPVAFTAFVDHLRSRAWRYRERVQRQARVRPGGLAGAVVSGFDAVITPAYPVAVHESLDDAFTWLCGGGRLELLAELDELMTVVTGDPPIVQRVRRALAPPLRGVTMDSVARALGISARTLQRRLQREGTTFQAEYAAAQSRAAQMLLRETDLKVMAIAVEVGCSSLASFSTMFRRMTGECPSAFRDRARQRA